MFCWTVYYLYSGTTDINRQNAGSWTALMYASYIGHDNIVNLLLDAGARVDVKSSKGATALMLTSSCGNESVGYFLIQVIGQRQRKLLFKAESRHQI